MDKWLATFQAKRQRIENSDGTVNTSQQETNTEHVESTNSSITASNFDATQRTKQIKKVRIYQVEYLKYGFTFATINEEPRPKCIICLEVLANDSMKPSRLIRHLKTKHPEYEGKPFEFFSRRLKLCDAQSNTLHSFTKLNEKCVVSFV